MVAASAADAACLKCANGAVLLGQLFVFRDEDNQVVQVNRNRFSRRALHADLRARPQRAGDRDAVRLSRKRLP